MRKISKEVKSPTFRTLLRMLLSGTGISMRGDIRRVDAMAIIREMAGPHTPTAILNRRNSGVAALAALLTSYTGREVTFRDALRCFCNPINRGLLRTGFLDRLLEGRRWPPFPPSEDVYLLAARGEDARGEGDGGLPPLLTSDQEAFISEELLKIC
jgi:hypothetical protein